MTATLKSGNGVSIPSSPLVKVQCNWWVLGDENPAYQSNVDLWAVGYDHNGRLLPGYHLHTAARTSKDGWIKLVPTRRAVEVNLLGLEQKALKLAGVAFLLSLHRAEHCGLDFGKVKNTNIHLISANAKLLASFNAPNRVQDKRLPLGKLEYTSDDGWEFTGGEIPANLKFSKKS